MTAALSNFILRGSATPQKERLRLKDHSHGDY